MFTTGDVLNLLQTNDGKYAAACGLDFENPPRFYDTFALRDSAGDIPNMQTWPFFRSAASRNAMIANKPVPVQSCWNGELTSKHASSIGSQFIAYSVIGLTGIVAMDTAPFYSQMDRLRFRGVPDSLATKHVEGSECCLVHADNPLSAGLGVWINPTVRVGYCHPDLHDLKVKPSWEAYTRVCQAPYDAVHPPGSWVSHFRIAWGLFENRLLRLLSLRWMQSNSIRASLRAWEAESKDNVEPGEMCLVDEMHVLEYVRTPTSIPVS